MFSTEHIQLPTPKGIRLVFPRARSRIPPLRVVVDGTGGGLQIEVMQDSASVYCPFCGQRFELAVDTNVSSQTITVDCEICCRPMELRIECEAGEILSLDVAEN